MSVLTVAEFDYWFLELVHRLAESAGSFFTPVLRVITDSGNHGYIFLGLTLVLLLFKKTRKLGVMALISIAIGYLVSNITLKNLVRRVRPYNTDNSDYIAWWKLTGQVVDTAYSFPSGHATVSAAFSICFIWQYGFKKWWPMVFVPLIYGFTRLYFVVHYPTDILAGWAIGTLASLASYFITKQLDKPKFMQKFYSLKGLESLFHKKEKKPEEAEKPAEEESPAETK
jgi:undecaprenyl-diphosphatase